MTQDTAPKVANATVMRLFVPSVASLVLGILALGGCQGNLGSGSGLNIPQTQPYGQPSGPSGGGAPLSRERALDGAVFLTPDMATLPLPALDGFAVSLQLGTPPPSPSPVPTASTSAKPVPAHKGARRTKTRASATDAPPTSPSPLPSASASANASALPSASPSPGPSAAPSPAPSSSSGAPSSGTTPLAGLSKAPHPTPSGSAAVPKTITKLVVYPGDAPSAPTPQPSGNVQSYPIRKALVRGLVRPAVDLPLYGLAAAKFTIPAGEDTANRGFTVAVFSAGKHRHDTLVTSDTRATVAAHVVASTSFDALVLKRNTTYLFVLYADEAAIPAGVPAGYPSPGVNPFVTPQPGIATPFTGGAIPSGAPGGYVGPTPSGTIH